MMVKTNIAKEVPVGVKVIAVFDLVLAGLDIILGLFSLFMILWLSYGFGSGVSWLLWVLIPQVISLGISVLFIFVGIGLWKARNWARITQIVFSVLGLLYGIFSIISAVTMIVNFGESALFMVMYSLIIGVFVLAINGLIGSYLLFSKSVKEAFV